jgi:hypothetical protein
LFYGAPAFPNFSAEVDPKNLCPCPEYVFKSTPFAKVGIAEASAARKLMG